MLAPLLLLAAQAPAMDKAAVEAIVREYILEHPEILPEAMERLQARETAKALAANRKAIETPFANAWEGAADADVTLVQFFDYRCGFCRRALADIDRLLAEDKKLRVVYREFPVLGEESEQGARVALSGARGVNYPALHRALYAADALDTKTVTALAAKYAVAMPKAGDAAIDREIEQNRRLQQPLQITGTPTWVVGDKILSGAVGYPALKAAIAEARASRAGVAR